MHDRVCTPHKTYVTKHVRLGQIMYITFIYKVYINNLCHFYNYKHNGFSISYMLIKFSESFTIIFFNLCKVKFSNKTFHTLAYGNLCIN